MIKKKSKDNTLKKGLDKKPVVEAKDSLYAKIAFYLSLGFWMPLFNVGLCITSIILASVALKKHLREPEKYSGLGYALAALTLSIASLILTIVGVLIFLFSDRICGTAICQNYVSAIKP